MYSSRSGWSEKLGSALGDYSPAPSHFLLQHVCQVRPAFISVGATAYYSQYIHAEGWGVRAIYAPIVAGKLAYKIKEPLAKGQENASPHFASAYWICPNPNIVRVQILHFDRWTMTN